MKLASTVIALAVAATFTAACDRPKTEGTAYNNSGNSAAPTASGSTTPNASPNTTVASNDTSSTATTTASGNTTAAPGPAGDATGAVSETMTTGKVKAAIASDAGLKDTDIDVSTNNGVVTLTGTVKSQDQISIAQNIAQKMDGVQKVETNLTVK
jgi:hyperosmotically inducible protein